MTTSAEIRATLVDALNYDREVFNGDLGWIEAIDAEEQETTVCFGSRSVTYDWADLNEITLAWACTIHKSQGSEFPVVIMPMYMQHYLMLSRNLLYTGLTGARQLAILVGPTKAIGLAVRQAKDKLRFTRLKELLHSQHNLQSRINLSNASTQIEIECLP